MNKKTIKVIKRSDRVAPSRPTKRAKSSRQAAREIVANVTDWVNDFQKKRRDESSSAVRNLLTKPSEPAEA